ncbi:MAG TPA: hypothetical protein VEC35_02925 [Noviherbaspirillum sp.]|nr:hypothetical protein [Noviherbaspirillum sp.]
MIRKIKQLDLDDAEAGMVLSEDVLDGKGGVLLPAKTELTDALLTSLSRRGIDSVWVVNNDVSEEELREERERVQQRVEHLFRKCRNDRTCAVLLQHISAYRLGE